MTYFYRCREGFDGEVSVDLLPVSEGQELAWKISSGVESIALSVCTGWFSTKTWETGAFLGFQLAHIKYSMYPMQLVCRLW